MSRSNAERLIADAADLARLPKGENLRIVTVAGQIPIPCGGRHVRNLKEIRAKGQNLERQVSDYISKSSKR
jgi:Ser-tRNA(Ala) deacylase AlaX